MSARVGKLQQLLSRVEANARKPRQPARGLAAAVSSSGAVSPRGAVARGPVSPDNEDELSRPPPPMTAQMELDEPSLSEPPPADGSSDFDDGVLDLDAEDVDIEEAPPESGAGLVGEAKSIEEAIEKEPDRPPMTPPPESGEEPAPSVSIPRDTGPTMEQLGNTISLDEAEPADFELDEYTRAAGQGRQDERLAADIPQTSQRSMDELELPANAREELERVRLGESTRVQPAATDRPLISTNVVEFVSAAREYKPQTFLELLKSSLSL